MAKGLERLADRLRIDATDRGVVRIAEGRGGPLPSRRAQAHAGQARQEVREYLRGERTRFSVSLDLTGLPPFQAAVLRAILSVGYGEVISYAALAARVGRPRAARAVGNALAANPIPLIVPCHRAVRADGTWHNYGLVGPALKTRLLALERSGPLVKDGLVRERRASPPSRRATRAARRRDADRTRIAGGAPPPPA